MQRETAIATLRSVWPRLQELGVVHVDLVGSVARDEATAASDVDVVVEIAQTSEPWRQFQAIWDVLESALGCRVDLMTRAGVKPLARMAMERDAVHVA